MDIAFAAPKMPTTGAIATGVMAGKKLSPTANPACPGGLVQLIQHT